MNGSTEARTLRKRRRISFELYACLAVSVFFEDRKLEIKKKPRSHKRLSAVSTKDVHVLMLIKRHNFAILKKIRFFKFRFYEIVNLLRIKFVIA